MIAEQMRAVRLHTLGDPAQLACERTVTPQPGPREVLVRVHAAAITRDELDWPEDRLPATPSYELSGVVAATGSGVEGAQPGEAVYALSGFDRDGAAADYIVVPTELVAPKPRTLDHVESAAIPLAGLSAWQGLFDHGKLASGETVLVHGAAGGVGSFAVQLARVRGAHVIATVSPANVQAALELGADNVIDHTTTRFEDHLDAVDLVFDTVGGDRLERSAAVLRTGARLVSIAAEPPQTATHRSIGAVYFIVKPDRAQLSELAALPTTAPCDQRSIGSSRSHKPKTRSNEASATTITERSSSASPMNRDATETSIALVGGRRQCCLASDCGKPAQPDDVVDRLERRGARSGLNKSRLAERYIDEGLRMEDHPGSCFVTASRPAGGPGGRRRRKRCGADTVRRYAKLAASRASRSYRSRTTSGACICCGTSVGSAAESGKRMATSAPPRG
jgi:NADPH:quinone reductase-like Zn-dependent oxidoreductase